jgi:hypothetical protein
MRRDCARNCRHEPPSRVPIHQVAPDPATVLATGDRARKGRKRGVAELVAKTEVITMKAPLPLLAVILLAAAPVAAEVATVNVSYHPGIGYLTGPIMSHERLIEKHAERLITKNPRGAAEIYVAVSKSRLSVDAVEKEIRLNTYTLTPSGVMTFADFMHRTRMISQRPGSWKEIFFDVAHQLPGN